MEATSTLEAMSDGTLSITAACQFTGLSRSELYLRMNTGSLIFIKMGKRRLIPKRALTAMLAANVVPANA